MRIEFDTGIFLVYSCYLLNIILLFVPLSSPSPQAPIRIGSIVVFSLFILAILSFVELVFASFFPRGGV